MFMYGCCVMLSVFIQTCSWHTQGVSSSSSEFDSSSASVATGLIPLIVTSQEDDAQGGE